VCYEGSAAAARCGVGARQLSRADAAAAPTPQSQGCDETSVWVQGCGRTSVWVLGRSGQGGLGVKCCDGRFEVHDTLLWGVRVCRGQGECRVAPVGLPGSLCCALHGVLRGSCPAEPHCPAKQNCPSKHNCVPRSKTVPLSSLYFGPVVVVFFLKSPVS
jgi:hypothetical protein